MLKKSVLMGTSVLVAASMLAPAIAQDDEIIVTATKREQTLQEVPISVSVTDKTTIERARIQDILDLQSVVPSLRVSQLQNSAQTNFIIRGFGNGANNAGIEPSVAVFIDGVYRSRSLSQISDLPNLERVEVLRGPQSTLFGKNASAGVISVVSSAPEYEWDGYLEGTVSNFDGRAVKGYLTGPLGDNAAFSLGGSYSERDGYTTNQALGTDVNDRNRYSVRGQLLLEPTENSKFRVIADYDELDEICCTVANLVNGPTGAIVVGLGGNADFENPFSFNTFLNFDPTNVAQNSGISVQGDIDFENSTLTSITAFRDSSIDREGDVDFTSADLIGSNAQSLNIETFTQEIRLASDLDGPFNFLVGAYYFDESITQEDSVKFGTGFDAYAEFLTGAPGTLAAVEASLSLAPGTFHRTGDGVEEFATQDNTSYSIFGQGDWEVSDRLTATLGISYVNDEKDVTLTQNNTDIFSQLDFAGADGFQSLVVQGIAAQFPGVAAACGLGPLPFTPANVGAVLAVSSCPGAGGAPGSAVFAGLQAGVTAAVSGLDLTDPAQNPLLGLQALQFLPELLGVPNPGEGGSSSDSNVDYTVRLAYDVNDNINVYGNVSTGYKATSWNLSRDSRPTAAELAANTTIPNNLVVGTRLAGPEETTVYELGLKGNFDKGSINIAVFDQEIKGFQSNTFTGAAFTLANAGKQSVQGVEFDTVFYPTDDFTFSFAGTLLDPNYDDFQNSTLGDISGTKPGGIHEVSLSTSATWNWEHNGYDGYVRADYQYESKVDIQDGGDLSPANLALGATGSRTRETNTLNASAGFTKDNFDVTIWARNITNDQYLISNFPSVAQAGSFSGYPNAPRTIGVSLRANLN